MIGGLDYISDLLQYARVQTHQQISQRMRTSTGLVRRPQSWVSTWDHQQHVECTLRAQRAQDLRASGVEEILAQPSIYFRD